MVSGMCDGIFILACAEYVFEQKIQHVQYTDSSSARQLASRQGCGKVRHVAGKILWIQQRVADGQIDLRQVETLWNLADIGTKSLSQQRLFLLMNQTGLVYVATHENVGTQEFQAQSERSGNRKQLRQLAKVILRMSFAMGLEPVAVMGQQCDESEAPRTFGSWWILFYVFLGIAVMVALGVLFYKLWKKVTRDIQNVEMQLGDHYEYAAWLNQRIDEVERMLNPDHAMQQQVTELNEQVVTHIAETWDSLGLLEDALDCIRYGLMEFGGFVRRRARSSADRSYMYVQERSNFVIWNMTRNRPENTDQERNGEEEEEEENPTDDEVERGPTAGIENLINAMRTDQNIAIAREFWDDSAQIQSAIMVLLNATAGANPIGMSMEVITEVRNVFPRLWRRSRNRNQTDRAETYRRYVDDMHSLMKG